MPKKNSSKRKAVIKRKTRETDVMLKLTIDGVGKSKVATGVGFLDHMLTLFAKHGFFDLELKAKGDLAVDIHHTNEDIAISLGEVFQKALGTKKGIRRYGAAYIPMDDALVRAAIDISNRPYFVISGLHYTDVERDDYYFSDLEHFMQSFAQHCGINLHMDILRGNDKHHIIEACFKALARALDQASGIDKRERSVPSTKGVL
ncbi:MAG: imidazoleglycerol-phosphate dehydratase HisB [Candidatus Omnitrophica bacterium]|nr:imidazoleglycerol-phosphate dehydratase HisB [Candidatus Omnitrophota bacterium]